MRNKRNSLLARVRDWRNGEAGISDVMTAIFVLPMLVSLLFTLTEVGVNVHYKASVDQIVQDAVRGAATDGGDYWARTNTIGHSWSTEALTRLTALCGPGSARCTQPPTVTCTPAVAVNSTSQITCSAVFYYKPVSALSKSPLFSWGLSGTLTMPIRVTLRSLPATSQNG